MAIHYPDDADMEELAAGRRRRLGCMLAGLAAAILVGVGLAAAVAGDEPAGDPGKLTETLYTWTDPVPPLVDVTSLWGLADWSNTATAQTSGGLAIGDVDGDGRATGAT